MHHHYLTIEQRDTLEKLIRGKRAPGEQLALDLARLHQPDYGVCIECGKDIGYARLKQDPWAMHCRDCSRLPVSAKSKGDS